VSFAPLNISSDLKGKLPAWEHVGAPPKTYHKIRNFCLKQIHNAKLVKDLKNISRRLTNHTVHKQRDSCICEDCVDDRIKGCKNPHECAVIGDKILRDLLPKYNPYSSPKKDGLTLTHRRLEKNVNDDLHQIGLVHG
ncbi:hypothetical protein CY34DRAFT_80489, partial [Suillus luteus UH-Slu-Lm8-n1]